MSNASASAERADVASADAPATLLAAILAVQGEVTTLFKDKVAKVQSQKGNYEYRYIGLDTIVEAVGPILNKHGLVWMTFPGVTADGKPSLHYALAHAPSGEDRGGTMLLPVVAQGPQALGSALTYARRYSLCAVLNLVADEDDDAKAAQQTLLSSGQLARARANMTDAAKALLAEADGVYSERHAETLTRKDYDRYKDSTGYTEDGLQKLVEWLRANAPAPAEAAGA